MKYIGETGIVENGYTEEDSETKPYQLNADGTATPGEYGKPTTTKSDPANTEPDEGKGSTNGKEGGQGLTKKDVDDFVGKVVTPAVGTANEIIKKGTPKDLPVNKALVKGLQYVAVGLAGYNIKSDYDKLQKGEISGAHFAVNTVMNVVGFLGPAGAGASVLYTLVENWLW